MKIYYDVYQYGNCLTECKVLKEIVMVGSVYCKDRCPHNQKTNLESSFVICEPQSLKEDEMKKFNLEEARNGKKVVTRDGQEVSQITKFEAENILYALRGVVGGKDIQSWTDYGKFRANGEMHPLDLFMATEKKTVWVNVYRTSDGLTLHHGGTLHSTKELAEAMGQYGAYKLAEAMGQYGAYKSIGTYPIEIEV